MSHRWPRPRGGLRGLGVAYRAWALEHQALYRLMFGGALAAYVDCQPTPDVAADAMVPLINAVAAAQSAGTLLPAPAEMVAVAIWGQVHGLVSLELAQMGPPDAGLGCRLQRSPRTPWPAAGPPEVPPYA